MAHSDDPSPTVVDVTHAQAHDEEEDRLDPDEPRTPLWMPLLGAALFVVGAIFLVATRPPGKTAVELQQEAATAAAAAQEAARAAQAAAAPEPEQVPAAPPAPQPGRGG